MERHPSRNEIEEKLSALCRREWAMNIEEDELDQKILQQTRELKVLQRKQDKLSDERKALIREKVKNSTKLDSNLYFYKGLRISEHAILQYIFRVLNVSPDKLLDDMFQEVDESMFEKIKIVGDGKYPLGPSVQATIVGNTMVTVFNSKKEEMDK